MIIDTIESKIEQRLNRERKIVFFQNLLKFVDEVFAEKEAAAMTLDPQQKENENE